MNVFKGGRGLKDGDRGPLVGQGGGNFEELVISTLLKLQRITCFKD